MGPLKSLIPQGLIRPFATALLICLFAPPSPRAQVVESWAARYHGPTNGTDASTGIAVDKSGNVYVTGWSMSAESRAEDYVTIKYSSSGDSLWLRSYNGTGDSTDSANATATDPDGNVCVTGGSLGNGSDFDFLTIKYDPGGDTVWTRRYNGNRNGKDIAHAMAIDEWGNIYVAGESEVGSSPDSIFENYFIIKYTSSGETEWMHGFNGPAGNYDRANAIAVDHAGNVYVTGISDGGATFYDYATVWIDPSGFFQGVWRYNGPGNGDDEASAVVVDNLGYVYVTGKAFDAGSGMDFTTIRYTETGQEEWISVYNGVANGSDEAIDLVVDAAGNLFVTGKSYGGLVTHFDYLTIRYNSAGDTVWTRPFDGPAAGADAPASIVLDTSGNVYVTGYSSGTLTSRDYTTIKYSSVGELEWEISYTNSGSAGGADVPAECALDSKGSIYVTGVSSLDYAVVKYVQTLTGLMESQGDTPDELFRLETFPNPFNAASNIVFHLPTSHARNQSASPISLTICDLLGRTVARLVNEEIAPGDYRITWDASDQASGVYFCRLSTPGGVLARKLVIVR